MTFQCASVRSMPIWAASACAEILVPLVVLGQEALVVDVDLVTVDGGDGMSAPLAVQALAGRCLPAIDMQGRQRHGPAAQQQVPVGPAEARACPGG